MEPIPSPDKQVDRTMLLAGLALLGALAVALAPATGERPETEAGFALFAAASFIAFLVGIRPRLRQSAFLLAAVLVVGLLTVLLYGTLPASPDVPEPLVANFIAYSGLVLALVIVSLLVPANGTSSPLRGHRGWWGALPLRQRIARGAIFGTGVASVSLIVYLGLLFFGEARALAGGFFVTSPSTGVVADNSTILTYIAWGALMVGAALALALALGNAVAARTTQLLWFQLAVCLGVILLLAVSPLVPTYHLEEASSIASDAQGASTEVSAVKGEYLGLGLACMALAVLGLGLAAVVRPHEGGPR